MDWPKRELGTLGDCLTVIRWVTVLEQTRVYQPDGDFGRGGKNKKKTPDTPFQMDFTQNLLRGAGGNPAIRSVVNKYYKIAN